MLRRQSCLWMCLQKPSDRFCAHHGIQIGCLKSVFETGALASHCPQRRSLEVFVFSGIVMSPAVHADAKRLCGSKRFTLDVGTPSAFGLPTLSKDIDEVVQKAPADNEWVKHALVKFLAGTDTVLSGNWLARLGITTVMIWTWHVVM